MRASSLKCEGAEGEVARSPNDSKGRGCGKDSEEVGVPWFLLSTLSPLSGLSLISCQHEPPYTGDHCHTGQAEGIGIGIGIVRRVPIVLLCAWSAWWCAWCAKIFVDLPVEPIGLARGLCRLPTASARLHRAIIAFSPYSNELQANLGFRSSFSPPE